MAPSDEPFLDVYSSPNQGKSQIVGALPIIDPLAFEYSNPLKKNFTKGFPLILLAGFSFCDELQKSVTFSELS